MNDKKNEAPQPIPIKADETVQAGLFSNLARISHGPEAFQVDFLVVHSQPAYGRLQARLILTPGHAKRLARALTENVERYEKTFGDIRPVDVPAPEGYLQ